MSFNPVWHMGRGFLLALAFANAALLPVGAVQLPLASYSTEDGLASDVVERIRQDLAGRLWFACRDGLSRFDGVTFVSYGEAEGLPAARVLDVLGSRDGRIWAATAAGLAFLAPEPPTPLAFDPAAPMPMRGERFVLISFPGAGSRPRVNVLAEQVQATDGEVSLLLWAGTEIGLFVMTSSLADRDAGGDGAGDRAEAAPSFVPVEGIGGPVWDLVPGREGELWLAAASGLWRRRAGGMVGEGTRGLQQGYGWERVELEAGQPLPRRLLWDTAGGLWMGHEEGGTWLRLPSSAASPVPEPLSSKTGEVWDGGAWNGLASGLDGEVWVATAEGLLELRPGAHRLFTEAEGLPGRLLTAATVDRDGNLWLGTEGRGVLRLARGGLLTYGAADGLAHPRISSLFEGPEGRFYVSSGDNRFLHVLSREHIPRERVPGEHFASVALNLPLLASSTARGWNPGTLRGRQGDWWVPTGRGLYRFAGGQPLSRLASEMPKMVLSREDGLAGDQILRLYEDRQGDLWIGSLGGERTLTRWRRRDGSLSRFGAEEGLPRAAPSAFAEDEEGRLWIGFDDGSLVRRLPEADYFEVIAPGPGRFPDFIYDLFVDHGGRLWIATGQAGLLAVEAVRGGRLDAQVWTTAEGLVANTIFTLTEDLAGRLYLGTPRGVQRLDSASGALLTLTTAAGLASNVVTVALRDRGGDLWFGTLEGLSRLRPELPRSPPGTPRLTVLFHELLLGGQALPLPPLGVARLPDLELGPGTVDLELAFRAVSFRVGERLRYQLRLGEDEPWRFTDSPGRLRLAGLRPGKYALEVRAVRPEGPAAGQPAQLAITVLPPLWRRAWFLALLVASLLLLTYVGPRLRLGRLLAAERVRRRIATDLHDDLGSNLARISVLSEVLDRRIEGDGETRRLLASVGETAREVSDALDDSIWSIDPRRDDLASLATRLRTFAADVLGGAGIDWHLEIAASEAVPGAVPLPPEVRRHVFLIAKEAITNIVRHAGAGSAVLRLHKEGRWVTLEVIDDGRGMEGYTEPEIGRRESGYGLASIDHRVRQLRGTLRIEPGPVMGEGAGEGTLLRVRLPLGRRAWLQRMIMRFSNGR